MITNPPIYKYLQFILPENYILLYNLSGSSKKADSWDFINLKKHHAFGFLFTVFQIFTYPTKGFSLLYIVY